METRPSPLMPLRAAAPLAASAGFVLWLAFPPVGLAPCAVGGVALLTAALWRASPARGFLLGLMAGGVFFVLLLEWMRVVGIDAWLLLTLLCAAWYGLLGIGTALVTRLPAAPVWVASIWVLDEALRARLPWGGFPWGNLSFALPDSALGSWAVLGGLPLASFAVALVGAALVAAILDARARMRGRAAGWLLVALATSLAPVLVAPLDIGTPVEGDHVGGAATAVVAVVQGGTPQMGLGAMDVRRAVLDNHVKQTLALAEAIDAGKAPQPDFVLWPENSTDIDPFTDSTVAADITGASQAMGVPILVGAVTEVPGNPQGAWNVGIVWDPEAGPTQMYVKTHPVPFGEYIPFRDFLSAHIERFDRIPRDFIAGSEPGNLDIGGVAVGNVICFEVAYSEVVRGVISGGARLLTVQTNNATYGGTSQPAQQLAISRMRAIENGRSVLVAATSGISAVILPDGALLQVLGEGQTGWLVADVPVRGELTPASQVGPFVEALVCLLAIAAVVVGGLWPRIRSRRASPRVDQ